MSAHDQPAARVLPSELRTPEQMKWIHDRFKIDGLERLARADRDYCDDHGHYLPDVAALAHAALTQLESLARGVRELLDHAPAEWDGGDLGYLVGGLDHDVRQVLGA